MREAQVSIGNSEFEALGIDELVSLCRDATLQTFEELECRGAGAIVQVEVRELIDEHRLDELEYVDQWERVTETDSGHLYVVGFTAPDVSDEIAEYTDELVGTCDTTIDEQGAKLSLVGSQETIRGIVSEFVESGVSPELRKLGEYEGSSQPMEQLTERQRDVLQTAYREGFYDVPRKASTEDVAAEVGVDPSTVAEHLQRAERNLLTQHLSATQEAHTVH